jgi:predicted DNA-binding protein
MTIQTEQIGLRLKLELVNKLRSYCADEGRSQTWVIDKALNQYLGISSEAKSLVTCKPAAKKVLKFHKPMRCEVADYMLGKNVLNHIQEAEKFIAFYESNGWKVGRNPMKNWIAAASGWISRNNNPSNKPSYNIIDQSTRTRDQVISNQLTNTDWAD